MSNQVLNEARIDGVTAHIDLWYPQVNDTQVKFIQVGLVDVRATDDIRISYEFDRDGWKIEQQDHDEQWNEVAFVRAFALTQEKSMAEKIE